MQCLDLFVYYKEFEIVFNFDLFIYDIKIKRIFIKPNQTQVKLHWFDFSTQITFICSTVRPNVRLRVESYRTHSILRWSTELTH